MQTARLRKSIITALMASVTAATTLTTVQPAAGPPDLTVVRTVSGSVLASAANPALQIRVDSSFHYIGAQRFILRDVADAEQHVFADADAAKMIRRMYWIQFEQYLPGRGGEYNYESDAAATAWSLPWRTHVRRFTEPPATGSDRDRVHQLLERHGFRVPLPSVRARLTYVPVADRRQELMIIYLEPAGAADPTTAESARLIQRAIAGLTISPLR